MTDLTLELKATPNDTGFDILAISAGEAKGHNITFASTVLQNSMHLFDGAPVFIDHASLVSVGQSVRNLAGTIHSPSWNMAENGIQAQLTPAGPAKQVLIDVRNDAKINPAIMNAVGFSTHLNVQLNNKREVTQIVKIKSVDIVIDPARGGKFLSALPEEVTGVSVNADTHGPTSSSAIHARRASHPLLKGVKPMKGKKTAITAAELSDDLEEEMPDEQRAALELQGANEAIAHLQEQREESNQILLAQCMTLLDTSLSASKLPAASQKAIRKPFEAMLTEGHPFKPTELETAIKDKRDELTEIGAAANIQGPGRVHIQGMFDSRDQFRLAVEDMFGVERETAEANIKVHKLRGIQDAYLMATGDINFLGGFYPEFALVTANFPGIVANVQNKMLIKAWKDFESHYGWWKKIATVEHFTNLNQVGWVRVGTIASLPTVAERGEYTELPIGDIKETSEWGKYGGYVPLTIEAILRDDLRAFTRMPREAALAGIRNISEQIAAIFTQNSAAGPTMTDTGALFNSTAQTTVGGHVNLLTTALGTDYVAWNAAALAMFDKKLMVKNASGYYGTGKKQALWPSICLVPAALKAQAEALFVPRWDAPAQNVATVSPMWGGRVDPVVVPDWTDATDWAAVIDKTLRPGIMIGEIFGIMPQIFSASSEIDPAMFANDESRIKVRQFLTIGVADDLPLHKNNVA